MKDPKDIRIIFFGTPDFAAHHLEHLIQQRYHVAAVVTSPDRPSGRGKRIQASAVKAIAEKYQLKLFQPEKLRDTNFLTELTAIGADLFIVIAFRMLPREVWQIPPTGTINIHASLLPDYRGAAPIQRAIMNGETKTGLTSFLINEAIDSGHLLLKKELTIGPDEDAGSLHNRMVEAGKYLLEDTINGLVLRQIHPVAQQYGKQYKTAPKIFREDCRINWLRSGEVIHNQVRALSPYPGAFFELKDTHDQFKEFKLLKGSFEATSHQLSELYHILTDNHRYLKVVLPDGFFNILRLQASGRKVLSVDEFLRGYPFSDSWQLVL